MSIFCIRVGCEIRLVGSKHTSQSLSDKPFVHTYTQLENYGSYMDVVHIEQLLDYWRHSLYGLELHKRFDCKARATDLLWLLSDTTLCVYTASRYIHCYLVCNYTWQQNSHTLWLHTTHQTTALLQMMHCFIRTKLASHTTRCSVFSVRPLQITYLVPVPSPIPCAGGWVGWKWCHQLLNQKQEKVKETITGTIKYTQM